jgi:hypothetical protein
MHLGVRIYTWDYRARDMIGNMEMNVVDSDQ